LSSLSRSLARSVTLIMSSAPGRPRGPVCVVFVVDRGVSVALLV
jgi:hypothetical protein